jgi:hypothetical protein
LLSSGNEHRGSKSLSLDDALAFDHLPAFAGFELLALPPDLISVTHYLKGLNLPGQTPEYHQQLIHFVRSYASYAAVHLIGTASSLGLAIWAYRAGPSAQRFFAE